MQEINAKITIALSIAFAVVMWIIAAIPTPTKPTGYDLYAVEQGDTLWSIAREAKPEGEKIEHVIQLIKVRNELADSNIYIGDMLEIPVYGGEKK